MEESHYHKWYEPNKWYNINDDPPDRSDWILVWVKIRGKWGPVACQFDYNEWCDVIDKVSMDFEWWMLSPPGPDE